MFSYLTTLLGTNVRLGSSSAILAAPIGGYSALNGVPYNDLQGPLGVQGHRGAQGVRTEASLYAFAYAMEVGVDTLEMDLLFTKDEIPIIWHDHSLEKEKCAGDYVGQFIANLTLAQIKTMHCGLQLVEHPEQEVFPSTRIATLEEVLDLITCYDDREIWINIETKLDPRYKNETFGPEIYVDKIIPVIEAKGFTERTYIQSFDFRTLFGMRERYPQYPLVALLDPVTIMQAEDGSYPWLGGIQLDSEEYKHDWVLASAATGAKILGPWHGNGSSVVDSGYVPFTTRDVVQRAHALGMEVHPWTVDDERTISKLIDDGCDSIISNYPEKVLSVGKHRGLDVGRPRRLSRPECLVNA